MKYLTYTILILLFSCNTYEPPKLVGHRADIPQIELETKKEQVMKDAEQLATSLVQKITKNN